MCERMKNKLLEILQREKDSQLAIACNLWYDSTIRVVHAILLLSI